jgi:hypothetical protein
MTVCVCVSHPRFCAIDDGRAVRSLDGKLLRSQGTPLRRCGLVMLYWCFTGALLVLYSCITGIKGVAEQREPLQRGLILVRVFYNAQDLHAYVCTPS